MVKEVRIYIKNMRNNNRSPVKNKRYLHSRHLASYLVYGSEAVVRGDRDIRNQSAHRWASGRDCLLEIIRVFYCSFLEERTA
jgi:hypothetical protein